MRWESNIHSILLPSFPFLERVISSLIRRRRRRRRACITANRISITLIVCMWIKQWRSRKGKVIQFMSCSFLPSNRSIQRQKQSAWLHYLIFALKIYFQAAIKFAANCKCNAIDICNDNYRIVLIMYRSNLKNNSRDFITLLLLSILSSPSSHPCSRVWVCVSVERIFIFLKASHPFPPFPLDEGLGLDHRRAKVK